MNVHNLSKKQILQAALKLRAEGRLFRSGNEELEDLFCGSIDRFCDIAVRLRERPRVLDIGAGNGVLLSLLSELGHKCQALDLYDRAIEYPEIYRDKQIPLRVCNVEIDPIPYPDASFDAAVCCQVLEHFTHSHLPVLQEIHRVLTAGGVVEIDVPNVVAFRNRSRLLRGKNITYDYEEHYLYAKPVLQKGMSFYPLRHNREFTVKELEILLKVAGFRDIEVSFLKSRRYRTGWHRLISLGTVLRDTVPSLRKSLIAFASK